MRHIIPISGKDSCTTAIVQMIRKPKLPYELFFSDVGAELPETYAWLEKVETTLKRKIHRVGQSLEKIINKYGILPSSQIRFCTREAKIEPMEEFIGKDEATVYFGIRADEERGGYVSSRHNINPSYPLKDLGIGLPQVYQILRKSELTPPKFFWKTVHDLVLSRREREYRRGFRLTKEPQQILTELPEWVFDSLFAWRSRSNCFFCFYQRMYEWVGLLEHHPDLFARAEEIENRIGNDQQEKPYTWIAGVPLGQIRKTRERIIAKRVIQIIKTLRTKRITDTGDLLTVTSCGLFCGK